MCAVFGVIIEQEVLITLSLIRSTFLRQFRNWIEPKIFIGTPYKWYCYLYSLFISVLSPILTLFSETQYEETL